MLTDKERHEIEEELPRYERRQAACIDALKTVQKHRGWVSDEAVKDVAAFLRMSAEEVDGVATFYNLIYRRPVGKHVIHVCDSVSCFVMGYEGIREHLAARLGIRYGETTADRQFTLLPIPCLGACHKAPAMLIDGQLYDELTPQKIDTILEEVHGGTLPWPSEKTR